MKTTIPRLSTYIATLTVGALIAFGAQAQPAPLNGRVLFKQKNCSLCHFFEARSVAPSVKTMKRGLQGDPAKTSAAISAAASHAGELKSWSPTEIRAMSEWLAGISFDEQAAAEATKPKPGSPEAKRQAAAKAKQEAEAKAKAAAEAKAQAKKDAEAKAKAAADAKAQAGKDAAAKAKLEADAKAQAARDADAQSKREAAAKKEKEDLAKREAEAKARKDTTALEAIKREGEERAKREAEAQATAKREAEAKAKRDADALAAQKREADERARLETEAKAKKEAEAQAAKKPEAVAKAEPPAKAESAAPGGRKKIAYRDGSDLPACPTPTGAPLGAIDEGGAKAVIERVGCPQCHAYVQKKTGPPMKQIHEKYKGDWECVVLRLTKNKTHKEEGVTDDLKGNEAKIVADYIATRNK